jgi:hypothetical protein
MFSHTDGDPSDRVQKLSAITNYTEDFIANAIGVEIGGGPDGWPGPEDLAVAEDEEVRERGSGGLEEHWEAARLVKRERALHLPLHERLGGASRPREDERTKCQDRDEPR